jgi:hypothetical protein
MADAAYGRTRGLLAAGNLIMGANSERRHQINQGTRKRRPSAAGGEDHMELAGNLP